MFLEDANLYAAFQRLRHNQTKGKKGLERTSGLMYLLAFDKLVQYKCGQSPLDFDPSTEEGRFHRRKFSFNFSGLVSIRHRKYLQIAALGEIKTGSISPEKRVSANFLTVPLTKAAQAQTPCDYPSRPVPLLVLGDAQRGMSWRVDYHPQCLDNLGTFLLENGSRTPFTDLAIVILRDHDFPASTSSIMMVLHKALATHFTQQLTDRWMKSIEFESLKPIFPSIQFQESPSKVLEDPVFLDDSAQDAMTMIEHLKTRVTYLESRLAKHGIEFDVEYQ
jgi:hypothetical protein